MEDSSRVRLETDGPVAVVTLTRPRARNALDLQGACELDAALSAAENDTSVRAVVLAAEGPAFCAGADLKALAAGEPEAFIADRGWGGLTRRRRAKPIIAAVEGPALAGGLELVLACDLVIASHRATFGTPEVRWGLIAAAGGVIRLPHRVPSNVASEMLLTGEAIDAECAHAVGLVNRLVEQGDAIHAARTLGIKVAGNAPLAIEATIETMEITRSRGEDAAWSSALASLERLRATEDAAEGLAAFSERRRPLWRAC